MSSRQRANRGVFHPDQELFLRVRLRGHADRRHGVLQQLHVLLGRETRGPLSSAIPPNPNKKPVASMHRRPFLSKRLYESTSSHLSAATRSWLMPIIGSPRRPPCAQLSSPSAPPLPPSYHSAITHIHPAASHALQLDAELKRLVDLAAGKLDAAPMEWMQRCAQVLRKIVSFVMLYQVAPDSAGQSATPFHNLIMSCNPLTGLPRMHSWWPSAAPLVPLGALGLLKTLVVSLRSRTRI